MNRSIMEELVQEARYAQNSLSGPLLHEVYGEAKMARKLGAITADQFMELNHMTVYFINTHVRELENGQAMSAEDMETIVAAEEKRLGVGSEKFMQCHNGIMEALDGMERRDRE